MSRERNIAAQERFAAAVNSGDFRAFDEVIAPGAIDHNPAPGQVPGPEGFRRFFTELRSAFPDLKISVDHLITDEDHVAFAYTMEGTHKGKFLGFEPTGKYIRVHGLQIGKFANGQLVERRGSSDQLGILQQLKLMPLPSI